MVRSRFLMQKCNNKTYGYHVYYFFIYKTKTLYRNMWESVKSGDGFRLMGSGLARGAYRPLIAFESSTHQLGVRS